MAQLESGPDAFYELVSGELRTPLNAIIGISGIMVQEMKGPLSEEYKAYAEDILGAGQHLLCVINAILDEAKRRRGIPIPVRGGGRSQTGSSGTD